MENYDLLCSPMHHRCFFRAWTLLTRVSAGLLQQASICAHLYIMGVSHRMNLAHLCLPRAVAAGQNLCLPVHHGGLFRAWTLLTWASQGLQQQTSTCANLYIISLEHEPCSPEHLQGCGSRPARDRWRMPGPVGAGGRTPSRPLHLDPCTESVWPAAVPPAAACAGSGSPGTTRTKR